MINLLTKIFGIIFEKSEVEKEKNISYFKSLIFLALIVVWVAKKFMGFNIVENLMYLLPSEEIVNYILIIMQIGVQFFTTFAVMAFFIMVISGIIFEIIREHSSDNRRIEKFFRMKIGSESRLINSIENVIISLGIGLLFDKQFLNIYQNMNINYFESIFVILCICVTVYGILQGVLNRFFVYWTDFYMLDENK